jgi:hypothetical protein
MVADTIGACLGLAMGRQCALHVLLLQSAPRRVALPNLDNPLQSAYGTAGLSGRGGEISDAAAWP